MKNQRNNNPWIRLLGGLASAALLAVSIPASAQDEIEEAVVDDAEEVEEITVTGSRIKRNTYTSVAPLQVITGEVSRNLGTVDPATILQDSTASAGMQFDTTFTGFVLDNGPGASTVDLRGLGASRTLVLLNGRRLAPAGVEGVPIAPDLNVIPSSLVSRYEILLDGASSIYGSDALAGVANIILRKDFDGLEFEAYTRVPDHDNGIENVLSAAWGMNSDRGFFGVAVEYADGEEVLVGDRPWSAGCSTYVEETRDGEIRTTNIWAAEAYGMAETECTTSFGSQRIFDLNGLFGSIYATPGTTNIGMPGWSEGTGDWDIPLDMDGDGVNDLDFTDYYISNEWDHTHLLPERERISFMTYGEYTFEGDRNITPYFEATYNKREMYIFSGGSIIQEEVPALNPYNPCNPAGFGYNCYEAYNTVVTNPQYVEAWQNTDLGGLTTLEVCAIFYGLPAELCTPTTFGWTYNTTGVPAEFLARPMEAQFSIRGDRSEQDVEVEQTRIVAGIRGDLPGLSFGDFDNWSFDIAAVHTESSGTTHASGVHEERLRYSLETSRIDPVSGEVVCGDAEGGPCVPVNLFAPSLYQNLLDNELASQAERDYLFDTRIMDTKYRQRYISGVLTGDLFDMPAGSVSAAVGLEWRNDEIVSIPNDIARDGALWGFYKDLGANGDKDTKEAFVEFELPLMAGKPGVEELTLNFSSRYTDDEFFDGAWTYSSKLAWRPVDSFLVRGTVGTSYRAPNLRENFLEGISGFNSVFDPCVVPPDAVDRDINGNVVYDPGMDTRNQAVMTNCMNAGVDPTSLGISQSNATSFPVYGIEILQSVGQLGLREEGSDSWTAGFSWELPFEGIDMSIGATYYEIEIVDEIISLNYSTAVSECYNDAEFDSPYCSSIRREDLGGGDFGLIYEVDEAFINRDSLKTRGLDLNLYFNWPTQMFGKAVDLGADLNLNRKYEFSDIFISVVDGSVSADSDLGEFGLPEWEGQAIFRAEVEDFRFTWATRFLGSVEIDPDFRELLPYDTLFPGGNSWTCLGDANGDTDCRPVGHADSYFRHDFSVYWYGDTWEIGAGARNVLDEAPPRVDGRAVFSRSNTPFGVGYDINGRQYFINVRARFDTPSF